MKKYLITQYQETETPTDCRASNGAFLKETVVCEAASEGKETFPSKVLYGWLWLNQIEYSIHRTQAGGFVAADGSEVWQPGDCSADLPHLASTLVVSVIY
jgi:hypothetical protein